jgi:co-chaperonin GroES (HSP10)
MKAAYSPTQLKKLIPLQDNVIVTDMNFGQRVLSSGIIVASDDGKGRGIRPRWGQVYAVGPDQKDIEVGDWILVTHGRWTRGVKIEESGTGKVHTIRKVDLKDVLAVSVDKECPSDDTMGDGI